MSEYNKMPLLMDLSRKDKFGVSLSDIDVPLSELPESSLLREDIQLPELSQLDVVRYFTNLSQMNYSIDTQFYPLGSCTMKYNPKINDQLASLKGFSNIHPLIEESLVQGSLELMFNLQSYLSNISGMTATSLSTMAGAQGELAGVLMIKAFHEKQSTSSKRNVILIPDSAHGTNPASASMAGFSVKSIPSDQNGNMDIDVLKENANENLAGIMLTLPSTLGLFDNQIVDICNIVHEAGGLVYGDGANMNAWMGQTKLGDLGFDVIHINLHKTFSTPHGGGGPGSSSPSSPSTSTLNKSKSSGTFFSKKYSTAFSGKAREFSTRIHRCWRGRNVLRQLHPRQYARTSPNSPRDRCRAGPDVYADPDG